MTDAGKALPSDWRNDPIGTLRPAVQKYMRGGRLNADEVALMRAYFTQWINAPAYEGKHSRLHAAALMLASQSDIDTWIQAARREGLDPL